MRYFIYCRKSTDSEDRQVLSLETQLRVTDELLSDAPGAEVVEVLQESRSAKKPGRPLFSEMLRRIERGEADGIVSWQPDRLARNAVDGGHIIHLLDTGKIKDLRFSSFKFENNAQGKLMLSMLFSFSKYYVDSMSVSIKDGSRTKALLGWRPHRPPLGYLTDPVTRHTIPDPERFSLVQQLFRLMLTGAYSPRQLLEVATHQWGLRTRLRPKGGGVFLHLSTVYAMLKNPFYAGVFEWEGQTRPGKHQPIVSLAEFDAVQAMLGRPSRPRPIQRTFAYTGLIRCGACGLAVTAEHKLNRFGSAYTYYHCTRRKRDSYCREKSISLTTLEREIVAFLEGLKIAEVTQGWVERIFPERDQTAVPDLTAQKASLYATVAQVDRELKVLTRLRLQELIEEEEFVRERTDLTARRLRLLEAQRTLKEPTNWIEPSEIIVSFCNRAAECFLLGDSTMRRLIVETVGSNPVLKAGKLSIETRKPFVRWGPTPSHLQLCTVVQDVRTFLERSDPDFAYMMMSIKRIMEATTSTSEAV